MKYQQLTVTFLVVTSFAVGCKPSTETSATGTGKPIARQLDDIKKETNEAARDMQDFAYAQMQSQLDESNADLDRLTEIVEASGDAAKAEAQPKLKALRDKVSLLTQQVDKVKNASESTWGDVKSAFK